MKTFFVSSTFKDMQAERDVLHQVVFPALRNQMKAYGEEVDELDLRWGVDTSLMSEAESGRFVIETCLDAIDRCRPYMIVLIGERYGWIPGDTVWQSVRDTRMDKWKGAPISITQLEILYGALECEDLKRCIFCFRNERFSQSVPEKLRAQYSAESEEHRQRLAQFKEKIKSMPDANVLEYTLTWDTQTQKTGGLENFAREVTERLTTMLEADLHAEQALCFEERILRDAQLTAKKHMRTYVERSKLGDGASVATGRGGFWFYGEGGCGKSAFLSSVYTGFQKTGVSVFIYYCGNANCAKTDTFLDTLLYWLRARKGEKETLQGASLTRKQKLKRILELLSEERHCSSVILVDAADQMDEDITKILLLLGKAVFRDPVEKYTFGMAVTSTDTYYDTHEKEIEISNFFARKIGGLEPSEAAALAQRHAEKRGKHISGEIIEIIRTNQRYTNPYYLSIALQEIFMMHEADFKAADALAPGMQGIALYMQRLFLAHPEDIREMTLHMLSFTAQRFDYGLSEPIRSEIADADFLFRLLAVSENGLSLREMEILCRKSGKVFLPMAAERLFTFLYDALGENTDGRWNFTHRLIREGLIAQLAVEEKQKICGWLCEHYAQSGDEIQSFYYALKSGDENRIRMAMDAHKTGEGAYLSVLGTHLSNVGIEVALNLIKTDVENFAYLAAKTVLADTETAIRFYDFWLVLLTKVREEFCVSAQIKFYLLAAQTALLRYGDDKSALLDSYIQMCDLFTSCTVQEAPVLFEAVLGLLCTDAHVSYAAHIRRGIALLSEVLQGNDTCAKEILSVCTDIEMLVTFWQSAQKSQGDALVQAMTNIRITVLAASAKLRLKNWVGLSHTENCICFMLYSQLTYVAEELRYGGKYSLASEVLGEVLPYYTERIEFFPTADERIGYAIWLLNKSGCVKTEFQGKYIALFQEQWQQLLAHAPLPYFERLLGYGYYLETENLKAQKRDGTQDVTFEEKIQIAYNKGIRIYEKLCAERNGEEQYLKALDMLSYFLYNRINTRLEFDIWNWKEDRAYYYKKGEQRKAALMEADLENIVKVSKQLCKKEDNLQRLYELAWGYVLGIRYYNYRQNREKAILYCEGLLECMDEILRLEPTGGNYTKAVFYMELAECAERLWCEDKAREFAGKAAEHFSLIKAEWIEKKKYTQRIAEEKVRALLVLLRTCAEAETLQVYIKQAQEELLKFGDGRAEQRRCMLWTRALYTSLGMWHYKNGYPENAIKAFEAAAQTYTRAIASLYMKTKEPELIEITRFLEGQTVYALLKENKGLADACLKRFAVTVEANTPDENSAARPLLLEFVKGIAPWYKAVFGEENENADIHFVLMETKAARWEENYQNARVLLQQSLAELAAWEQTGDIAEDAYLDLLKACAEAISKAGENCENKSERHNEIVLFAMELKRKYAHHYWAVDNVRYAVSFERDFTDQFVHRKELMEEAYSAQDCLTYWQELKKKILASVYHSRNAEADIANLQEFGLSVCYRNYEQTRDLQYLHRALEDIFAYRDYLEKRIGVNAEDDIWFKEVLHGFYTKEQEVYLTMQEDGRVPEEAWLPRLLASLGAQLQIKLFLPPTFYPKKLDMLYALLNSGIQNQLAVQKAIDMTQAAQSGKDSDLMYYMYSALRELGYEASAEEAEDYIRKLKEKYGE